MVVSSIEANITWMNALPKKNGIYKTISPSAIMLGTPTIDATHTTLQHLSYVHFKFKTRIMINMKTCSVAEIILRISNERGGNYFMSLNTGL